MTRSSEFFAEALRYIPGGVNSPARSFQSVGGEPVFMKSGSGAYMTDLDGKTYLDYIGSWGPLILGHSHPNVIEAMTKVLYQGVSFGTPTEPELYLAEKICQLMPSIEKIRMVNSGTEATMTAIRLARGYTGRDKIIKFNGCYHGHNDALLVESCSGLANQGKPSSLGIPEVVTANTLTADYNDLGQTAQLFKTFPGQIAAVIVEPIAGNMGFVLPCRDFLPGLRALCDQHGSLLIFDEVMTGFRVALGGAQEIFEVTPDLTTLGKTIGGGLPVGALGGRAEIMDVLAPLGGVYQAGTLSGNPLAMAAGLATLQLLSAPGFFDRLGMLSSHLVLSLIKKARNHGISLTGASCGGMFGFCFSSEVLIRNFSQVLSANHAAFKQFFHGMLAQGIYFAPSHFESGFISSAHQEEDIELTLAAADRVYSSMKL